MLDFVLTRQNSRSALLVKAGYLREELSGFERKSTWQGRSLSRKEDMDYVLR